MTKKILKVALPRPLHTLFDYLPPEGVDPDSIMPGSRILIPFGAKTLLGFFIRADQPQDPKRTLKYAIEVLDQVPLFKPSSWQFLCKAQQYYHHPIGEVIITGLPVALRKGEPIPTKELTFSKDCFVEGQAQTPEFAITDEQKAALKTILGQMKSHQTFLLQGVTGSGKTEIYLQILKHCQDNKLPALVLLPEISLTPQTLARFEKRLCGKIYVYHSQLTPKNRLSVWTKVQQDPEVIVIGTRSALFLPFTKLGAIIVDEEHDSSFKQQDGFRYSARDLAVLRGKIDLCPVILGSATPSFESLFNSQTDKYSLLELPNRVNKQPLPTIELIDVRHKKLKGGISHQLIDVMKSHLQAGNQVLLFLNRRGYAPAYVCFECGHISECNRCDAKLIYHHEKRKLICHHCQKIYQLFSQCPECMADMNPTGIGTERLEEEISDTFPDISTLRIDSDTTRKKGELEKKLNQIKKGEVQILIGTQLLAKGHHFPNLTLVAIIDVDGGLFSQDFRAVERMGQVITQVAGRAGRVDKPGKVVLQTCQPEHPLLTTLIRKGYTEFAQQLLEERKVASLPPYSHLAIVRAQAKSNVNPETFLTGLKAQLRQSSNVEILGPIPALMSKKQGFYRFHLLLQAPARSQLHQALRHVAIKAATLPEATKVQWSLDVDPLEIS